MTKKEKLKIFTGLERGARIGLALLVVYALFESLMVLAG